MKVKEQNVKTYIYVDAFNLYYGCLKGTSFKWLDLNALCRALLPKADIQHIRYFTARVAVRDGDQGSRLRQQVYLRALQTLPNLTIHEGQYLSHVVRMRRADPPYSTVRVIKTEEKGSDVNLAAFMIADGYKDLYEQAAIISNDSDLAIAVTMVSQELKRPVRLLAPVSNPHRKLSKELGNLATSVKKIRQGVLRNSQFPEEIKDAYGIVRKPAKW